MPESCRLALPLLLPFLFVAMGCGGLGETADEREEKRSSVTTAAVDGYTSHPSRIYVDGDGDDWSDLSVRHTDTPGDGGRVDLERVWIAHDEERLFLRLELGQAINLQEGNDLTLYVDTDNDPTTGQPALGLGAELAYTFGERSGRVLRDGEAEEVTHADVGLTSLPTVTSKTFEIAFDRSAAPHGDESLFESDSLRMALTSDGDRLPDTDGGLGYILSDTDVPLNAPELKRPAASAVRLLSYNSANDFDRGRSAIFLEDRQPSFRRIFEATAPDVIAFQEIYDQTAEQVATVAEEELGLPAKWAWAKRGEDLVVGSRYPILDMHTIAGYQEHESGAFLLDADDVLGTDLIVVNMHPPCCNYGPDDGEPSRNVQRQQVVDGVIAFLREVKQGKGPFGVPEDTPIVVLGDMNFVGDAQQPRTLRTGEIVNTERFGSPAAPDWDGSSLLDTAPRQVGTPLHTTWIAPGSSFPPGRLDYAFVTDSVLEVVHEFVLHTLALSPDVQAAHGLEAEDTSTVSDHLPVVIDVVPR